MGHLRVRGSALKGKLGEDSLRKTQFAEQLHRQPATAALRRFKVLYMLSCLYGPCPTIQSSAVERGAFAPVWISALL